MSCYLDLVYLKNSGFALKIQKSYSASSTYYTEKDVYIEKCSQKEIGLHNFINSYSYRKDYWFITNEQDHLHEMALKLCNKVQVIPGNTKTNNIAFKIFDENYRSIIEEHNKEIKSRLNRRNYSYNRNCDSNNSMIIDPNDSKNYEITVTISDNYNSESNCLCSSRSCYHRMAVCEFLEKKKTELKNAYIHSAVVPDKSMFISDSITNLLKLCTVDELNDIPIDCYKAVTKIVEEITSVNSESYFGAVLEYLFRLEPPYGGYDSRLLEDYSPLIGAFYINSYTKEIVINQDLLSCYLPMYCGRQDKSNFLTFKREIKSFQNAEKLLLNQTAEKSSSKEVSIYKKLFLQLSGDGNALLKYYAENVDYLTENDFGFIDFYLDCFDTVSETVKNRLLDKIDQTEHALYDSKNELVRKLLKFLTPDDQAVKISNLKNFNLDFDNYSNLKQELKEQLAAKMQPNMKNLVYIFDNVAKNYDDKRMACLIFKLAKNLTVDKSYRDESLFLIDKAKNLKYPALIKLYLAVKFNLYEYFPNESGADITEQDILSYFRPEFLVTENSKEIQVNYFLFLNDEVLNSDENYIKDEYIYKSAFRFYESGKKVVCDSISESYFSSDSIKRIVSLSVKGREAEFAAKKQSMQSIVDVKRFKTENALFSKEYEKLCDNLQQEKVIFADSYKVNIKYEFQIIGNEIHLSFKVGNVKEYIVKDVYKFLTAFKNGETIVYGKDLVLTHSFENLNENDQPVITFLLSNIYEQCRRSRFMILTNTEFSNIIELLKDRIVWIDDRPTHIRLEPVNLKLKVSSDYILSVDYHYKSQYIITADTKSYIYTKNTKNNSTIDYVNADTDQFKLINFVLNYGGISIHPILDDFKRNIYSRFYDLFNISDEVKNDFKLSVIRINAYFDYVNGAITLKTTYLKDDTEISRSMVTERIDVIKVENFETSMMNLGFDNNILSDEGKILSFLKMDFTDLKRQAGIYLSESLSNKKLVSLNRQVVRVNCSKSGLIDAMLEKGEFTEDELTEILQAMKKKKKYILLSKDRIIDLDSNEAREFRETVKDLGLEIGNLYSKKRLDIVAALKAMAHENICSVDKQLRMIIDEIRDFKNYEVKLPKLSCKMRGYQEEGYRWLNVLSTHNIGGVLADDMGLGKTLQIIALIKSDKTKKPSIIVCPKSLVFNWINEFTKFDGETDVIEIYGPSDKRRELIQSINYNEKTVYVTSYDSLRNDIENYSGAFNYCIVDEAQYIKNVMAQKSKSVKEINADHRFALTGTPIENNIIDLWSIFDFVMPGYFEALNDFKSSAVSEDFQSEVAKRIGPFVLRRVKENVLSDLPARYETILSCEMTENQRKAYEALRKKARDVMESGEKAFDLLPMLMQLRQVCVDPAMCIDNYVGESGKMQMLEELIPNYLKDGHRILIFSQFVKGLNQVEKMLKEQNISYYMLTGETSAKDRTHMIDEFNSTYGINVFLISLKAGGIGLNLTGADTVIHLDPWWNVAAENQASDRAHRIGQTKNVEVIKLISENSIEQKVIELQNKKKDLFDRVISKDDSSVTNARLEDIAFILE